MLRLQTTHWALNRLVLLWLEHRRSPVWAMRGVQSHTKRLEMGSLWTGWWRRQPEWYEEVLSRLVSSICDGHMRWKLRERNTKLMCPWHYIQDFWKYTGQNLRQYIRWLASLRFWRALAPRIKRVDSGNVSYSKKWVQYTPATLISPSSASVFVESLCLKWPLIRRWFTVTRKLG